MTQPIYHKVMAALGGPVAAAGSLKTQPSVVGNWKKRGIPADRCQQIARLTGISLRELRPDDWQMYWPDAAPARKTRAKAAA